MRLVLAALLSLVVFTQSDGKAEPSAEPTMAISEVRSVQEVEPAIYEIVVVLQSGTTARLRMNAFTLASLFRQLAPRARN